MNILILGFHVDSTVHEIKKINPNWNITWIGQEWQRKVFDDCEFSYENLQYGHTCEEPFAGAFQEYYQTVFSEFPYYMRMMTRVSGDGWVDWSFQEYINLFNLHYDFFASLFKERKIDFVLFSNLAHEGFDCMAYLLAKAIGIKVLMATQSPFPNKFFCIRRAEEFGLFDKLDEMSTLKPVTIEKKHFKHMPYLPPAPAYGINLKTANSLWKLFFDKGPARLMMRYYRLKAYNKNALKTQTFNDLNLNLPFVYFPLHTQPELSTSAIGGVYEDQLLAIERLSKNIPSDWLIYVKENPIQTEQYRGDLFYRRFKKIANAVLVSNKFDTYKLIQNCKFVATVTGTAGWEAITGGKNVLVFGYAWYRQLPGVFEYNDTIDVLEICNNIIDHKQVESQLAIIQSKMADGIVNNAYTAIYSDFDKDVNAKVVAENLTRYINNEVENS